MEKNQVRAIGVALAEAESEAIIRTDYRGRSAIELMKMILERLSSQELYFLHLSYYIHMLELATSVDSVYNILFVASEMEHPMCWILEDQEVAQWRDDLSKSGLLVYFNDAVFAPVDFRNRTHQALMLSARNALGRIRHQGERGAGVAGDFGA
jgi:hypothetical protein